MAQDGNDLIPEPGPQDHVRGSLDSPVVLTEFGDFECPFCGRAFGVIEEVLRTYGDRIAFVFRNYPLQMHAHARAAAEAAEAAGSVGKFWEMYDQLYRHQAELTDADLRRYAEDLGIDGAVIDSALKDGTFRARIARDQESGDASGIAGTPALFINGFAYDDPLTVASLSDIVERALAAKKAT